MRHLAIALVLVGATPALAADSSFANLADQYWDEALAAQPTFATEAGIHEYDDKLPDLSKAAIDARVASATKWKQRFAAVDASKLSLDDANDLATLRHAVDADLVEYTAYRRWRRLPRYYVEPAINGVYLLIKRDFAPLRERMKSVIAREEQIGKVLTDAKANLDDVDPINVDLALTELPFNSDFLQKDVVLAFASVKDAALQQRFAAATKHATAALNDFAAWLKNDLRPRAHGHFAVGGDVFAKMLAADEGITEPLDQILARGEAELARLRAAFVATAKKIDPSKPATEVQAALSKDHPTAAQVIPTVQSGLASLRQFLVDKSIVTIPSPVMPIVQETPPFMRAFTLASMETPGPYEKRASEAYYNVTLPDPHWTPAEVDNFLGGNFSRGIIETISIHEAFPGHYVQFLWMPKMRSRTRKLYSCSSNAEGWAHYSEQMMVDEGVGGDDPKLRLMQLQDALLRAARYVVGIRMHTRGMTLAEGIDFFEKQGMQARKVAEMEAKRGTENPTYLYYTYGKLEILKLRDDYKKKLGAGYSLRRFHDAFLSQGAIPLPLVRRALLAN
ncbi:MAG: DUF885 domain-containing protein [Myxococcales bacterium]|nr:DUF885 domain-containing protein [Myxococcales bacterium]